MIPVFRAHGGELKRRKFSFILEVPAIMRLQELRFFVLLLVSATMLAVSSMTLEIIHSSGVAKMILFASAFSYEFLLYDSLEVWDRGVFSFLSRVHLKFTISPFFEFGILRKFGVGHTKIKSRMLKGQGHWTKNCAS